MKLIPKSQAFTGASVKYNQWNDFLSQNTEQVFSEISLLHKPKQNNLNKKASEIKTWILSTQEDKEVNISGSVRKKASMKYWECESEEHSKLFFVAKRTSEFHTVR